MKGYAIGIPHPARVLRGGWPLDIVARTYLDRARITLGTLESGGQPEVIQTGTPPPGAVLAPTLADLRRWRDADLSEGVTVDIEAAGPHIRCIGYCRVADEVAIVCPFRRQGGALYWPNHEQLLQAIEWNQQILADPAVPKIFHNLMYDVPELEAVGFKVRGLASDTMMMQHVAYPEMPKSLQFCGTFWCELPVWKTLAKETEEEAEGK